MGAMPNMDNTDTPNVGNLAHVEMNSQITTQSKMAGEIEPNTGNTGATTDNTTRATRMPIRHGTTRQVTTRHALGQHDTDRHGPPLVGGLDF